MRAMSTKGKVQDFISVKCLSSVAPIAEKLISETYIKLFTGSTRVLEILGAGYHIVTDELEGVWNITYINTVTLA